MHQSVLSLHQQGGCVKTRQVTASSSHTAGRKHEALVI
jgi:hypothetical protein